MVPRSEPLGWPKLGSNRTSMILRRTKTAHSKCAGYWNLRRSRLKEGDLRAGLEAARGTNAGTDQPLLTAHAPVSARCMAASLIASAAEDSRVRRESARELSATGTLAPRTTPPHSPPPM